MPRPGPRPYECVRRAWHSDRHLPMKGSIIQQIFRVVYDSHSPATKQNKEWQEKLPIVVFKAEEIMYSKANSEAEYLNLETLWDRVNDAVNTIIRRDESTETGQLLPPCIEAALNLGCVPVRASRSQRHSNPRSYLPRVEEHSSPPPRISGGANDERFPQLAQRHSGNPLNLARGTVAMNSSLPAEPYQRVTEHSSISAPHSYPYTYENTPPGCNQLTTKETSTQLNEGSIYPLYYGNQCQAEESQLDSVPDKMDLNTIFVGKPIGTSVVEPGERGGLQNFFSYSSYEIAPKRYKQANLLNSYDMPSGRQCDLSLRLALLSDPYTRVEGSSALENEEVGSSSSQDKGKFSNFPPQKSKEFCFFPDQRANHLFGSCSTKWFPEADQNLEATIKKRKAPLSENVEDEQFCRRQEFPPNQFMGQIEGPDHKAFSLAERFARFDVVKR